MRNSRDERLTEPDELAPRWGQYANGQRGKQDERAVSIFTVAHFALSWRDSSHGAYVSQGLSLETDLWFEVETLDAPLILGAVGITARSGVTPTTYFLVDVGETVLLGEEESEGDFSPFASVDYAKHHQDYIVFEVLIDTTDMPQAQMQFTCPGFVLELDNDTWITPDQCSFMPDSYQVRLTRGERYRVTVAFSAVDMREHMRTLVYRRDEGAVTRTVLWEAESTTDTP